MRYLVYFKDALGQEWEETLETECQVLEHQMKECIVSVKKIEEELTLEQLQEQINNKTLQEVKEADFMDKHIKVGDIIYFQCKYWDHYDNEYSYENFFGKVKSLTKQYERIRIIIEPIANDGGKPINFDELDYLSKEIDNDNIETIWDVCTSQYFDTRIKRAENDIAKAEEEFKKELQDYCKQRDKYIERLKVLKGML